MDTLKHNLWQFFISLDQILCCLIGVILTVLSFIFKRIPRNKYYADETLSSRCYRLHRDGITSIPCIIIDTLLFFDRKNGIKHCELSYISEQERLQCPPELRK